jgi:hypothetical protein
VLNVAFFIVAFLCSFIGGAGYYMYGTAAADIVIFNMPGVLAMLWCVFSQWVHGSRASAYMLI